MDATFINRLDEQTAKYLREALADSDTDNDVRERLADLTRQAAEAAQIVEAGASADDALVFTHEVYAVLDKAKTKALEAKRIEANIEAKRLELSETQAEIERLNSSLLPLADVVTSTRERYEAAQYNYKAQEFKIASLEGRKSLRRAELTELRRRLAQIKTQEAQA
jgi:chromosome segregation ATPase